MKFVVETSARHVHVTQEDLETLFGKGHELTKKKDLSQPGQFACEEKVTIVGSKKEMKASILGPVRPETQVELSLTDARSIGVDAPIRESGDVAGSGACKLVGPAGEVELKEGVIAAKRHIHATPEDAEKLGVKDKDVVSVKIDTEGRRGHSYRYCWYRSKYEPSSVPCRYPRWGIWSRQNQPGNPGRTAS